MTRIAEHLLLQDLEGDAVLLDERTGAEIVIPHDSLEPLADTARYLWMATGIQHHSLTDLLNEWSVADAEGTDHD